MKKLGSGVKKREIERAEAANRREETLLTEI